MRLNFLRDRKLWYFNATDCFTASSDHWSFHKWCLHWSFVCRNSPFVPVAFWASHMLPWVPVIFPPVLQSPCPIVVCFALTLVVQFPDDEIGLGRLSVIFFLNIFIDTQDTNKKNFIRIGSIQNKKKQYIQRTLFRWNYITKYTSYYIFNYYRERHDVYNFIVCRERSLFSWILINIFQVIVKR